MKRLLLVEDDRSLGATLHERLLREKYEVAWVETKQRALKKLSEGLWDLVILDIGLPDVSGVDVYKRVAARWPELPVLFSSGHADPAHLDEYLRRPNVGMLVKPYDFEVMMQTLTEVIDGQAALLKAS